MPPKRRRQQFDDDDDELSTPVQTQRTRRRTTPPDDEDDDVASEEDRNSGSTHQLSKNLVRYALACEYARMPIKRQDINQKVFGAHKGRFREVYLAANSMLLDIFGMEFVELPLREKITMREKRAANANDSQTKTSNQWILRTVLPDDFRTSDIIGPTRAPSARAEEAYTGLYTMVVSLIRLSNGTLPEGKLERYMKRMNADQTTPLDITEKVLARMVKEGYIVKVKDNSGGDEIVDYVVGPRGKLEVSGEAVANVVRTVYTIGPEVDDLERKLARSLGLADADGSAPVQNGQNGHRTQQQEAPQEQRRRGRPRRGRDDDDDE